MTPALFPESAFALGDITLCVRWWNLFTLGKLKLVKLDIRDSEAYVDVKCHVHKTRWWSHVFCVISQRPL